MWSGQRSARGLLAKPTTRQVMAHIQFFMYQGYKVGKIVNPAVFLVFFWGAFESLVPYDPLRFGGADWGWGAAWKLGR